MKYQSVHIVGICGTLMGPFAAYLKRSGVSVTGSDMNIYPPMSDVLESLSIPVMQGYSKDHLAHQPDLVVIGNVIRKDNPEAVFAFENKMNVASLPEFMEKNLLQDTQNIVVAGTHGKTTTSSLLSHVYRKLNCNPSYFIGGVSPSLPESFYVNPKGKYFILEGDEYDTAFWDKVPKFNHYLPDHVILSSLEFDHADIYQNLDEIKKVFKGLIERIRPNGSLVACSDYKEIQPLIELAKSRAIQTYTYGEKNADYTFNVDVKKEQTAVEVLFSNQKVGEFNIALPGKVNALNALSAWIQCRHLGHPMDQVEKALSTFEGVKRRQEVRAEIDGITVIDDFAHHPTAVELTLDALKKKYQGRRLIVVFEPRSATSRRKIFQERFLQALSLSDLCFLAKPYDQSRINESERFSSEEVISGLGSKGVLMQSVDQGVELLSETAKPGDVIAVLSNGGFEGFIPKLLEKLKS